MVLKIVLMLCHLGPETLNLHIQIPKFAKLFTHGPVTLISVDMTILYPQCSHVIYKIITDIN